MEKSGFAVNDVGVSLSSSGTMDFSKYNRWIERMLTERISQETICRLMGIKAH